MAKLTKKEEAEIIKALKKAGHELTGEETQVQLIKLAESLEETESEDEEKVEDETDEETEEEEDEDEPTGKNSVDVLKRGKMYVRTFSKELHGAKYKELAEEFVSNPNHAAREYSVVPSSEVPRVIVNYREKADFDLPLDRQKPDAPIVDKEKVFTDKEAALAFAQQKKVTVLVHKKAEKK